MSERTETIRYTVNRATWRKDLTPREVELCEIREVISREERVIHAERQRAEMVANVGRCFRTTDKRHLYKELLEHSFDSALYQVVGDFEVRRFVRVMRMDEYSDHPVIVCCGFEVVTSPASLLVLPEWRRWGAIEPDEAGRVVEVSNIEYHKAWMDAVEALTLP